MIDLKKWFQLNFLVCKGLRKSWDWETSGLRFWNECHTFLIIQSHLAFPQFFHICLSMSVAWLEIQSKFKKCFGSHSLKSILGTNLKNVWGVLRAKFQVIRVWKWKLSYKKNVFIDKIKKIFVCRNIFIQFITFKIKYLERLCL